MSDDESFLVRWSRRKRDAASKAGGRATPERAASRVASEAAAVSTPVEEAQPLADLASLPPIESIGAGADIRAFLAPGVPAELTRAALRRAWSVDPTIRDFIGLSENSWDFNAPGGVPGFGSVTAEDVRRLLTQLTGEPKATEVARVDSDRTPEGQAAVRTGESNPATAGSAESRPAQEQGSGIDHGHPAHLADANNIATQHEPERSDDCPPLRRRRHGGALPE